MLPYYVKKTFEILREEGPKELYNDFNSFYNHKLRELKKFSRDTLRYFIYYLQYGGSTPRPHKIIKLNPTEINLAIAYNYQWYPLSADLPKLIESKSEFSDNFLKYLGQYAIIEGSWDRSAVPIVNIYHVKGLIEHFVLDKEWKETSEYNWLCKLEVSEQDIITHFDKYERIYWSIRNNGFNSNYPVEVCIGRDGKIMRSNGFHRITISNILGLDEIPAKVTVRHKHWQELREDIYSNGFSEEYDDDLKSHPDLQDILY